MKPMKDQKPTAMKISHPKGSVVCIVAGKLNCCEVHRQIAFAIWCPQITYEFSKLDTSTNPTTVECQAFGCGPAPSSFTAGVKGTIVYDLDGLESSNPRHSNFLTFKSTMIGVDVEIVFEVSSEVFNHTFSEDQQHNLVYRRSPEPSATATKG
jgi:hypothetical protein